MCFRLYAALRPVGGQPAEPPPALEQAAARCGLDARAAERGGTRYVEISWGDCACSLYTKKEGRERVVRFIEALQRRGDAVQLVLFSDGDALAPGEVGAVPLADFRDRGLQALPEGHVVEIR